MIWYGEGMIWYGMVNFTIGECMLWHGMVVSGVAACARRIIEPGIPIIAAARNDSYFDPPPHTHHDDEAETDEDYSFPLQKQMQQNAKYFHTPEL